MGIKDFTKVFEPQTTAKYDQLSALFSNYNDPRPVRLAIDAMNQIHKSATWKAAYKLTAPCPQHDESTACVESSADTKTNDVSGGSENGTAHILVTLASIRRSKISLIDTIWVFDHFNGNNPEFHLTLKSEELDKRREKREKARAAIRECQSDDKTLRNETLAKKHREAFSVNEKIVADIQFILDALNVPWTEAPAGADGEAICAAMTRQDNPFGICDAVLSDDTDTLTYGAKTLLKKNPKSSAASKKSNVPDYHVYILDQMLDQYSISRDDLVNISVMLGSDFATKTRGVGPKTVLNKYKSVVLDKRQQAAVEHFKKQYDLESLVYHNLDQSRTPEQIGETREKFVEWLRTKGFSDKTIDRYAELIV
jgi:5'-3' exonuclease